jgi:hypothetical protein
VKESVMGDLLFVAVVVAFFAVTLAYVKGCERIVGPDTPLPEGEGFGAAGDAADADAATALAATAGPNRGGPA